MKRCIQPVERRANVFLLAVSAIMLSFTHARATKVEAQHREAKAAERFHGVVNDLVVHGAAEQRMRMADQRGMRRVGQTFIQQGLEPA